MRAGKRLPLAPSGLEDPAHSRRKMFAHAALPVPAYLIPPIFIIAEGASLAHK
jgi:hypothetical protein